MKFVAWCVTAGALLVGHAAAADFGTPGGPAPANIDELADRLRQDPYDLELLISYGTSKGGSAGHLALAIRDQAPGDDLVYSANFYADREPAHEKDFYTGDLMVRIPKKEYLFRTTSSLDPKASFGLDFGEIYKRSVIGVRVYGVPAREKEALAAFFGRINDDYHQRVRKTEYHDAEIKYDYLRLNCAKTIGTAFKLGAGYKDLEVTSAKILSGRPLVAAANANIPTEMAMKLVKAWDARGYGLDVVLYKKYVGSTYVDPHENEKVAFKDLPNRFPSVLSRDFRREQGQYEDLRQPLRGVLPLQHRHVQRARERRDEAARDREAQAPHGLPGGRRACRPGRQGRQRELPPAHRVPDEGDQHRGRGELAAVQVHERGQPAGLALGAGGRGSAGPGSGPRGP